MPRILAEKDVQQMIQVLEGLADLFGETYHPITFEEIIARNKTMECFEAIETEEKPSKPRTLLSKEPFKFGGSIVIGILIVFGIFYLHCSLWSHTDFLEWLNDLTNFAIALGIAVALGVGIREALKRST